MEKNTVGLKGTFRVVGLRKQHPSEGSENVTDRASGGAGDSGWKKLPAGLPRERGFLRDHSACWGGRRSLGVGQPHGTQNAIWP